MSLAHHFQSLFERSRDGMLVFDASHRVIGANAAAGALAGGDGDALAGRSVGEVLHPESPIAAPVDLATLAASAQSAVAWLWRPDGVRVAVEAMVSPLDDGAYLCTLRGLSARADTAALRGAEARFRALAENMHAGLVVTDLEHRAVYVNEEMALRTGYDVSELMGADVGETLFLPKDWVVTQERLARRRAGMRERYELEHRRKDGSTFIAEVLASPLHDGDGTLIGTVGLITDVTERRREEESLARSEQHYRSLFEVMPLPAWVYDCGTQHFLSVNPAAVERYGYSEEEFLRMTLSHLWLPGERETRSASIANLTGTVHSRNIRHATRDGTVMDVEVVGTDFEFAGRPARVCVVNDVTEQRRLRERQREMEDRLVLAQKMDAVGRLAGGVAHDFNNLLSVVMGAAEAIGADLPPMDARLEDVNDIRAAAERGGALTRQLLAFGRKEVHAPTLLDLNDVIGNVERLLARALGDHIRFQVERGVRSACTVADASQLEQVLVNLAINARDAMPRGGTLTVRTGVRDMAPLEAALLDVVPGRYVTIEVRDTGVGMDDAARARAFEPFFTTKGPQQGSGLGLSTVYGIARQNGGAVTLESTVDQGTCVTVLLPRAGDASTTQTGEMRAASTNARRVVLLVEDEPRVRSQARRLLERSGYDVIEAADGAEGERAFDERAGTVDVIVTDIVMPNMSGAEMVSRIRARAATVPVVFVSGYTADDQSLPLGDRTLFVAKPYTVAALCEAIRTAIAP